MSNNIRTAVKNKSRLQKTHGPHSNQHIISKAETKKLVKIDQLNYSDDQPAKLSSLPPYKQLFAVVQETKQKQIAKGWALRKSGGSLVTNKEGILETWAWCYENLYANLRGSVEYNIDCSCEPEIPSIFLAEVMHGVKRLKQSNRPDNTLAKLIKAGSDPIMDALSHLFNVMVRKKQTTQ